MNLIFNDKKFDLAIILIFPILFSVTINLFLNVNLHHDSLLMYLNFKFLYNYLQTYNTFPEWIDYIYSGLDASVLYLYDVSKVFFPSIILGKFLNINSYIFYLFNISLMHSIFLFGIYKNINNFKYKIYILLLISCIFLSFSFAHKAFSANLEVFLLFPFIFFYTKKFISNRKFSEINKILVLLLIGYLNSIQYFSIFFIYFVGLFIFVYVIFNFRFYKKIKFKIKYIFFYLTWLLICLVYFLYIEKIVQEYYFLPNRAENLDVNSSLSFALHGYHNILIKFLVSTSNFFWWDVPLTISLVGIFFICFFFFSKKLEINFKIKISLLLFIFFIIFLSETIIFYDLVKLFYNLPFLSYFRHFSFVIIYLKPLLLIIVIFGIIEYFKLIERQEFFYFFKFKLKFIFYLCLFFALAFCLLLFINSQLNLILNGNSEKLVFKEFFLLFEDKLNYLGLNNRTKEIDLFRGLKYQILTSFLINLFSLIIIFFIILFFLKKNKLSIPIVCLLIIFSLVPGFIYNYSNYSMNKNINIFTNNSNLIDSLDINYKSIIKSDKNFLKINSVQNCVKDDKYFPLDNLSLIIPKFTIFYENINIFLKTKSCKPRLRFDFFTKGFKDLDKNYLHFNENIKYKKINNEKFEIYNAKNDIYTNISYSKNWSAKSKNKELEIVNYNGKIKIKTNNNKFSVIEMYYKNNLISIFAKLSCLIGLTFYFIFFKNLFRVFFLKYKLKHIK